jgi:hypothetical protein
VIYSERNLRICGAASQRGTDAQENGDGGFNGNRDFHAASLNMESGSFEVSPAETGLCLS